MMQAFPPPRASDPFCRAGWAALLLALAFLLMAGCTEGPERKITFVGRAEGVREEVDVPVGLNPLGTLHPCPEGVRGLTLASRVLVSPPEYFTPGATEMILSLRESLAEETAHQGRTIEMLLAPRPLRTPEEALAEGLRCGAVIVLWERQGTGTLELTLPQPARIPLRHLVHDQLCEFGNHREQVTILYLTVLGLAAMLDNRYDEAVYYMEAADRIDHHCLHLPGPEPPARGE